jgi:hypothetical protein
MKKLDRDLRRYLVDRTLYFVGGVCQPICININSDPASFAAHVIAQLETRDRLFELVPAFRALKSDHNGVGTGHLHPVDTAARCSLAGRANFIETRNRLFGAKTAGRNSNRCQSGRGAR